ncbi:TRAP transporter small permease [Robertmurraya korlensis]|uniref:TRAP transporter small permease n=1 Tax=Robertmurraya korlensis TaxID=519977 RepID=UPI00203BF70E|nr:TRAP transporter small permease [Robertmurraya korlensis]MCM3601690.1 TRAP transporter small permease [Robertmurraya korlensis]
MEKLYKFTQKLVFMGLILSGVAILAMMLLIVVDVAMRNLFNEPISGTYEMVQYFLMPLAIFPALAYTYQSGVLPKLSELAEKMPKKFQKFNKYLILVIEVFIFSLLTIYGLKFALSGIADRMAIPVSGNLLPVYPIYLFVPLGFLAVLWVVIFSTIYDRKKVDKESSI